MVGRLWSSRMISRPSCSGRESGSPVVHCSGGWPEGAFNMCLYGIDGLKVHSTCAYMGLMSVGMAFGWRLDGFAANYYGTPSSLSHG